MIVKIDARGQNLKKQAGAELGQAQESLGQLPLAWNFALAEAAYAASCG